MNCNFSYLLQKNLKPLPKKVLLACAVTVSLEFEFMIDIDIMFHFLTVHIFVHTRLHWKNLHLMITLHTLLRKIILNSTWRAFNLTRNSFCK